MQPNRPWLHVEVVAGAGEGNANVDAGAADELQKDGDGIGPNNEAVDDEDAQILGVDEAPKPAAVMDGFCGADILDTVEVLDRLKDVWANVGAGFLVSKVKWVTPPRAGPPEI